MRRVICFLLILSACVEHDLAPRKTICAESDISITLDYITMASSCGTNDGVIEVSATGGKRPYAFHLDGARNTNGHFGELSSGAYSVTVIDSTGCESTLNNVLVHAEGFAFDALIFPDTDCTTGNGSVTIDVSEGTPPFQFQFMDGEWTDNATFSSLEASQYEIRLQDGGGCAAVLRISIPEGDTGTSWSDDIQPIMQMYCALSGCHNGISRPDLRLFEKAKPYAAQIKSLTQDGSMPFEGSLTQDQIDLIACWVDEGASNN